LTAPLTSVVRHKDCNVSSFAREDDRKIVEI
jgi:hypothetical protein